MANLILFVLVLFVAPILAGLSQVKKSTEEIEAEYRVKKVPFFLSFFILGLVLFLTKSGTDIKEYYNYYLLWDFDHLMNLDYEPGFKLIFIILSRFIPNPYIGIGIVKVVTLALFYRTLFLLKNRVNFGFSVFAYVALLYIPSFQLLRMSLAIACVFYAFANEIIGNKKKTYLVLVLSFFFHYSSIFAVTAYIIYRIIGKKLKPWQTVTLSATAFLIPSLSINLIPVLISKFAFLGKYNTYLDETVQKSSGLMQIIWFIPVCIVIFAMSKKEKDNKLYTLGSVCGIMLFLAGSLGYYLAVASRSMYYFYFFIIIYCSSLKYKMSSFPVTVSARKYKCSILYAGMFIYIIVRFCFELFITRTFRTSGLMEYKFLWQ